MRWNLWLSQSNIGHGLRLVLRATGGVCAAWLLVAVYALWSAQLALATEKTSLGARRKQAGEVAAGLRRKRAEAARADLLKTAPPDGAGSTEFADELDRLAYGVGAELITAHIGIGNQPVAAPTNPSAGSPPANSAANPAGSGSNGKNSTNAANSAGSAASSADPAASAANGQGDAGAWKRVAYECSVIGTFEALMDFLDQLATSARVFDIGGVQALRTNVEARTGTARLRLQLTGTLYGLPEKP